MSNEDKRYFHIWITSFLSLALCAVLTNVWFNDIRVAEVSWHARTAYKLLGTIWPLLVLVITAIVLGVLTLWRRGFLGLVLVVFIALFIWVSQGFVLSWLIGDALLQSEPKNAEFYYLLKVLVISKNTLLFCIVIFSIALWVSDRITATIANRAKG